MKYLILVCCLFPLALAAQFSAGSGSGADNTLFAINYANYNAGIADGSDELLTEVNTGLFQAGNGSGSDFDIFALKYASFQGGLADGYADVVLNPFNLIINAGSGDGFASSVFVVNVPSAYKGGSGDGSAALVHIYSYPVYRSGGTGDGFAVTDNNFYKGGSGDGFAMTTASVSAVNFKSGSGDGFSSRMDAVFNAAFNAGNGDGFAETTTDVYFIKLLSNIFGSFCAGSPVTINYYVPKLFEAGNVFRLQLSDPAGSFTSPVNIGSLQTIASGNINGTLPRVSAAGVSYILRVISEQPNASSRGTDSSFSIVAIQPFYADVDNDLYGDNSDTIMECSPMPGYITDNTDCNDQNPLVHPLSTEVCSDDDDDCDGLIDEGIDCSADVNVTLYIEGYYSTGGTLISALQDTVHPFNSDSIQISLARAVPPYDIMYISNNVVNTTGIGIFSFSGEVQGRSFYLIFKHRNSLETWSKVPVFFDTPIKSFNLSTQ